MNRRYFLSLGALLAEPRRAYSFLWSTPLAGVMTPAMYAAHIREMLSDTLWVAPGYDVKSWMEGNRICAVFTVPPIMVTSFKVEEL